MADLNRENAKRVLTHTGPDGNASALVFTYTADAAAAADVIYIGRIPAGATVLAVGLFFEALGGTLDVGYTNTAGAQPTAYFAAASTAAAGGSVVDVAPVHFTEESEIILTVGGGATGKIDVVLHYIYVGTS